MPIIEKKSYWHHENSFSWKTNEALLCTENQLLLRFYVWQRPALGGLPLMNPHMGAFMNTDLNPKAG